jgi:hypothetical protein
VHDADDDDDIFIFGEDYCVDDDDDDAPANEHVLKHGAPSSPAKQAAHKIQPAEAAPLPTASTQASARQALQLLVSTSAPCWFATQQADIAAGTHALLLRLMCSQHLMCVDVACRGWRQSP